MKAFAAAVIVAVLVAWGASYVLNDSYQSPTHAAFTTEGARVSDPGANLLTY